MSKPRILIAEDERIVAEDIKRTLEKFGYSISSITSSGEETVKKAQEEKPDLMLMDIVLEGEIDGIEAARQIRERLFIPVVYLTAFADDRLLMRAKITEPYSYLLKPFEDRELYAAIEMALSKHAIEMKLIESEEFALSLLTNSPNPIIVINPDTSIRYVNSALEGITDFSSEEIIGIKPPYPWKTEERLEQTRMNAGKAMRMGAQRIEELFKKKNGEEFWVEISSTKVAGRGKLRYVLNVWNDITARKQAEEELRESKERLRSLADYLQSVRENERTAIAREIHDELGQALTGLNIDLSWLAKKVPENEKVLLDKIRAMSEMTTQTIRTVQRISTDLRPGLLDDLGLVAAIEWQTEEFKNRTGIRCTLTIDPEDITIDDRRSTSLFRILQETLTNVTRHAQSTQVYVSLQEKDRGLELMVKDNGTGISEEHVFDPKSLGLIGIRERAYQWGGEVKINGSPGKGTTVVVRMPIEEISRKAAKDAK